VAAGLGDGHVAELVARFDLGTAGRLSDGPMARGRIGAIWRLDTDEGRWAVKQVEDADDDEIASLLAGAAFQDAAFAAGVPTPAIRRTRGGDVITELGDVRVRVNAWVDLDGPRLDLDAPLLGELIAALHCVEHVGTQGVHPWYTEPVGALRWAELVRLLRERGARFADELEALVPDLVALERYLGGPPKSLRTCHRDLWADNIRRTAAGDLCVFDFDDAGFADPSQELALVLVEFAGDVVSRARAIRDGYVAAGGPGRVEGPRDFAMVIAQLSHIVEEGCRRWLAATTDDARADNEGWIREFIDRPLTPALIERLLDV
jgi:Ser/Thr protein kinase RdoA (MazF antagonist)